MKYVSTCYGIGIVEDWCKHLVRKGVAKVEKDSSKSNGHLDIEGYRFYTVVYTINILPNSVTEMLFDQSAAVIRICYDRRFNQLTQQHNDQAELKISQDSMRKLLGSVYISSLIKRLAMPVKDSNNIAAMLEKAINAADIGKTSIAVKEDKE
jgi:hypothetical protein